MSTAPEKNDEVEYESGSESGSGSESVNENMSQSNDDDIDVEEIFGDDDDEDMDPVTVMAEILETALITPEGETICGAVINMGRQLEMQNKILVKLLATLQKN